MNDQASSTQHQAGDPAEWLSAEQLSRLKWRCRRGMLENDLILTRFLERRAGRISNAELPTLLALLEIQDNVLWDILAGRSDPEDLALLPLVAELRSL